MVTNINTDDFTHSFQMMHPSLHIRIIDDSCPLCELKPTHALLFQRILQLR